MYLDFVKPYDKQLQEDILKEFRRGDRSRELEFFNNNLVLAVSALNKTKHKYIDTCLDEDDLFQYLSLELWRCVQNYKPSIGCAFSTYAHPCLFNCIAKHTRDVYRGIRYGRNIMLTARKVWAIKKRILREEGIEPSLERLSEESGFTLEEINKAFEVKLVIELDMPVYEGKDDKTLYLYDVIADNKSDFDIMEFNMDIEKALSKLEPKQKECFLLQYYEGKTQNEIAKIIDMSQAQVSRYIIKAMRILKRELRPYLDK